MKPAVSAAVAVARAVGLRVREPALLRAVATTVVHLVPEPIVARVVSDDDTDRRQSLERELTITAFLAQEGGKVAAPARSVHPGPYERDGMLVTLWEYVDHDPSRPLDAVRAGHALRDIHRLLRDVEPATLPHFARVEENRALIARLDLEPAARRLFDEVLDAVVVAVDWLPAELQAVHGDAHVGNVLRTAAGPVWSDFDKVCLAPCEFDIACNEIRARSVGRERADDDLLVGYGDHDRNLVSLLASVHLATLAAWTFDLARRRHEYRPVASQRLRWAADGLGC